MAVFERIRSLGGLRVILRHNEDLICLFAEVVTNSGIMFRTKYDSNKHFDSKPRKDVDVHRHPCQSVKWSFGRWGTRRKAILAGGIQQRES